MSTTPRQNTATMKMSEVYDGVPLHKLEMAHRVAKFGVDLVEPLVIASTWVVEVALLHNR